MTDLATNEASSISSMFTAQEETGLLCGMIQHEFLMHHAQVSSMSQPQRRWWANTCDESDNEDDEEIVACTQYEVDMHVWRV